MSFSSDSEDNLQLSFQSTHSSPGAEAGSQATFKGFGVEKLSQSLSRLDIRASQVDPVQPMDIDVSQINVLPGYDTLESESLESTSDLKKGGESAGVPNIQQLTSHTQTQQHSAAQQTKREQNSEDEEEEDNEEELDPNLFQPQNTDPPEDPDPSDPSSDSDDEENPENPDMAAAKSIKLPEFDPSKSDLTAKAWTNLVQLARLSGGVNAQNQPLISERELASKAILVLKNDAALWANNLAEERRDPNPLEDWTRFKEAFLKRFHKKASLAERTEMMEQLTQRKEESVLGFLDRVKQAHFILYENWPEPVGENGEAAAEAVITADNLAKKKSFEMHACQYFAKGLKDEIKRGVVAQGGDTLEEIVPIAQRIETSIEKERHSKSVAVVETERNEKRQEEEDQPLEVHQISRRGNRNFPNNRGRGGHRRNFQPRQPSQWRPQNGRGRRRPRFNGHCERCGYFGHKISQCYARVENGGTNQNGNQNHGHAPSFRQAASIDYPPDDAQVNTVSRGMSLLNPFSV